MSHKNLELTEKAITRHTKRLQKELVKINQDLKLSEAQNMLSRILGMKDFHELKKQFNFDKKEAASLTSLEDYLKIENFITLENAKDNLFSFFKNGNIQIIFEYLKSDNEEIKKYIQINIWNLFNTAAQNNQIYLLKFLINKKFIKIDLLKDEYFQQFFTSCLNSNMDGIKAFSYIFFDLNIPSKISKEHVGHITHSLTRSSDITIIRRFLNDERVIFQKNFYWNIVNNINNVPPDLSYCSLNSACKQGNIGMVKHLIEEEKLIPLQDGSTVQRACLSGNIELVQYLIDEKKFPHIYFKKNNHIKRSKNDITPTLDNSTLSAAILSSNMELVNYLIVYKGLKFSDYDYLAVKTAIIEASSIYDLFFKNLVTFNYIKDNAQKLFNEVISKQFHHNKIKLKQNQTLIAIELLKYSELFSVDNIYYSDNAELIEILENHYNQSAKYKPEVITDQDT